MLKVMFQLGFGRRFGELNMVDQIYTVKCQIGNGKKQDGSLSYDSEGQRLHSAQTGYVRSNLRILLFGGVNGCTKEEEKEVRSYLRIEPSSSCRLSRVSPASKTHYRGRGSLVVIGSRWISVLGLGLTRTKIDCFFFFKKK